MNELQSAIDEFVVRCSATLRNTAILDATTDERITAAIVVQRDTDRTTQTFIAKWYKGETGAKAAQTGSWLEDRLTARGCKVLQVPRIVEYDRNHRVVFQEFARGRAFRELVTTSEFLDAMQIAGQALAELHSLGCNETSPKAISDHINDLFRANPQTIVDEFPKYADLVKYWLDQLSNWRPLPQNNELTVPLHRDFQLRQLFYCEPHVEVIDWDDFAFGDAAFDVGYMISYLKTHMPLSTAKKAIEKFRLGYSNFGDASIFERLTIYEAFNLIRRSIRRLRLRDQDWENEIHKMMRMLRAMNS